MNQLKKDQFAELIIAMSMDYRLGKISYDHWIKMVTLAVANMEVFEEEAA
jgi:hypothetical protein